MSTTETTIPPAKGKPPIMTTTTAVAPQGIEPRPTKAAIPSGDIAVKKLTFKSAAGPDPFPKDPDASKQIITGEKVRGATYTVTFLPAIGHHRIERATDRETSVVYVPADWCFFTALEE
jgi:hypothetical protein